MICVLKVSQAWFLGFILLGYVSNGLNKAIEDKDLRKIILDSWVFWLFECQNTIL